MTTATDTNSLLFDATDSDPADLTPAPKPTRERTPKTAKPSATTTALEWLAGDDPSQALSRMGGALANLDDLLRQGEFWRSMSQWLAPWIGDVYAVLQTRHETAARMAWLEARAAGKDPAPLGVAEPHADELTAHLVAGSGFQCFAVLERGLTGSRSAAVAGINAIQEGLDGARACYSRPSYLAGTWADAELKIAASIAVEHRLAAKVREIDAVIALLEGSWLEAAAAAVLAQFGADVVAAGVEVIKGKPSDIPLVSDEMRHIQHQMATVDETVRTLPGAMQQSAKAGLLAQLEQEFAASRESLERFRENQKIAAAQRRASEIEAACRDFNAWREVGELATKHPDHFPEGFAAKWLDAGRSALDSIGTKSIWDALERIPSDEIAKATAPCEHKGF